MTKEEIINEIKPILSELDNGEDAVSYLTQNDVKWLNENIKALEREPCEDAISRDHFDTRVRSALTMTLGELTDDFTDGVCSVLELLKTEPSVRPKQKTGEWINGDCEGGNCNICGKYYAFYPESGGFNYCPNCGAKMESEE